jgi:phytoene synthase
VSVVLTDTAGPCASADRGGVAACRRSIAHHSKSFALASRLLPGATADHAAIVYAWCRHADDAVDATPPESRPQAVQRLRDELVDIYRGEPTGSPELDAFAAVVSECAIPREYPDELLAGMQMDCTRATYDTEDELLLYCHRVAGVVGLMMCHVMGLNDPAAQRHAAHLGIAMQLTNICRDVLEDWQLGRLYLPAELLQRCGATDLGARLGRPFPVEHTAAVAAAVAHTLRRADGFYRSGDRGLWALSWRCALAVRSARRIYAAIGRRVQRQGCDVTRGRAMVPLRTKLALVGAAALQAAAELPRRMLRRRGHLPLAGVPVLRFPTDVLPLLP